MIVHDIAWDLVTSHRAPNKAATIWLALQAQSCRGNLVLGATELRLATVARVARSTMARSLAYLESAEVLRWDRDHAVIRLNPRLTWNGLRMDGEEWDNALREWDGGAVDQAARDAAQREYLFGDGEAA